MKFLVIGIFYKMLIYLFEHVFVCCIMTCILFIYCLLIYLIAPLSTCSEETTKDKDKHTELNRGVRNSLYNQLYCK